MIQDTRVGGDRNKVLLIMFGICTFFFLIFAGKVFQNVDAEEIICIQAPMSGKLTWHTTAGVKWQGFGRVSTYQKLDTYEFQTPVRFNDGGHGTIRGSINYELPLNPEKLSAIHTKYGSHEAVLNQVIKTVVDKCVYMTGPLMSSKESYAEKRTSLIHYIEDQIERGVYKTTQKDVVTKDPVTNNEKTVTIVEIVTDENGTFERQEASIVADLGIKTSNFAVVELPYDDAVEGQIRQQQEITMKVQTAIASAKEAEQNAITVAKQGEANAAKAKWEQEVIKARVVTEAEQQLEVAKLQRMAADQNKQKNILEGQGLAERERLIQNANGNLDKKLAAWVEVNKAYAAEMGKQKWVPEVVMGAGSEKSGNAAANTIDLLNTWTAKQLSLDIKQK